MPGILLHEITLWLAAAILRVRSERSIDFPAHQEIGELRLNFIRLSPDSGFRRFSLAKLAPIASGILCLWLIAAQVFNWHEVSAIAASGSIDDIARALGRLTKTADFWLWFYLAFTVANTMFPAPWRGFSGRRKGALTLAAGALIIVIWRVGGENAPFIALVIERLMFSLALVLLQTIAINIVAVLVLGALEAATERVTGRSATFVDGTMITMSRKEAQARKTRQMRDRTTASPGPQAAATAQIFTSIYDMKLPIPGPPGREPVSRSAVRIVAGSEEDSDPAPGAARMHPTSLPQKPGVDSARSTPTIIGSAAAVSAAKTPEPGRAKQPERMRPQRPAADGENAPFSRPFAIEETGEHQGDREPDRDGATATGGNFARPFATETRTDGAPAISDVSAAESQVDRPKHVDGAKRKMNGKAHTARTRPAPKPSASRSRNEESEPKLAGDELTYEPMDDDDIYCDDDDDRGATPPSS